MASLNVRKHEVVSPSSPASEALSPTLRSFYRQLAAEFPLGMAIVQLRDPGDVRTWRAVAANALASQEIGSTVEEFLAIPAVEKNGISKGPNPKQVFRRIHTSGAAVLLGYIGGGNSESGKRSYALTGFPLSGDCVGLLLQDATLRVNTQWDLLRTKMQMREISESLRAILWRAHPDTLEFTYVSKAAEEIFGYWLERWSKETGFWKKHTEAEDWELVRATCAEVAADGKPRQFECGMLTARGERRQFQPAYEWRRN